MLDGECVRRWAAKKLSVSQGRLSAWLGRGLAALGGSSVLPKELAKLRALRLVFTALAQPTPAVAAAQFGAGSRMAQQQQQPVLPELAEAERLTQCAHAAAWLASQPLDFDRSSGRFSSEQEWRTVAAKRRDGAGPLGLFLTDMLASLAAHGVPALAYPAPSTDRLLSALFCMGAAENNALLAKLALLAYHLLDGGFMAPEAIVEGLRCARWRFSSLAPVQHAVAPRLAVTADNAPFPCSSVGRSLEFHAIWHTPGCLCSFWMPCMHPTLAAWPRCHRQWHWCRV